MEAKCNNFVSNAWKKDLCVNCQRHETDHRQRLQDGSSINKQSHIATASSQKSTNNNGIVCDGKTTHNQKTIKIARPPCQPPPKPISSVAALHAGKQSDTGAMKSKLPTRNNNTTRSNSSAISSSGCMRKPITDTAAAIVTDSGVGNKVINHEREAKKNVTCYRSPPPTKPKRVTIKRSESARQPTPANTPRGKACFKIETATSTGVVSQQLKKTALDIKLLTDKQKQRDHQEDMTNIVTHTGSEPYGNGDDDLRTSSPEHELSDRQQRFKDRLRILEIDVNMLHKEDKQALYHTFVTASSKDQHGVMMYTNPFQKLAIKIKYHQDKHIHQSLHNSKIPAESFVSTENHYGSVDVTQKSAPDESYESYDNVREGAASHRLLTREINGGGAYDNAQPSNLQIIPSLTSASPKYDPVAHDLWVSQESSQSERIYAEVSEDITATNACNFGSKAIMTMSEYEVIERVCERAMQQPSTVTKNQTRSDYCVASSEESPQVQSVTTSTAHTADTATASLKLSNNNKMSFLKTLLKKGKKAETIGQGSAQTIDSLVCEQDFPLPSNGSGFNVSDKITVVNNWLMGHKTNKLVEKSSAPIQSQQCSAAKEDKQSLHVDTMSTSIIDNKTENMKCSTSPTSSVQRPDSRPPPPPPAASIVSKVNHTTALTSVTTSLSSNKHHYMNSNVMSENNKMVLTKDRNGDFIATDESPTGSSKEWNVSKDNQDDDRMYDAPWGDVDSVINSIIKEKIQHKATVTTDKKIPSLNRDNRRHSVMPLKLGTDSSTDQKCTGGKKITPPIHSRQTSVPNFRRDALEAEKSKSRKNSPTTTVAPKIGFDTSGGIVRGQNNVTESRQLQHTGSRLSLQTNSTPNGSSRSIPSMCKQSSVDSASSACLEQINTMNLASLQRLIKAYPQREVYADTSDDVTWDKLHIDSSEHMTPIFNNSRCVFYESSLGEGSSPQQITVMISLKEPVVCETTSPNMVQIRRTFGSTVKANLIPSHMMRSATTNISAGSSCSDTDSSSSKKSSEGVYGSELVDCHVSILPQYTCVQSVLSYLKSQHDTSKSDENLGMDSLFILLQVISLIFSLADRQLELESVSASDLLIIGSSSHPPSSSSFQSAGGSSSLSVIPTVLCHMIAVKRINSSPKYSLICEKLRMFLIQLVHCSDRLEKSESFQTVEDLINNSSDAGDLKTIALIIQYLLWGPKLEEVRLMSTTENRKQAFDLWLNLARSKLVNTIIFQSMDNLKVYTLASFLASTSGQELFKLTKLLSTYR